MTENEKYTFRTWLLRLGLIGDEFKTARGHLLENLDGCIAWRDPAQALAQKERMRQKKEKEMAEAAERQAAMPSGYYYDVIAEGYRIAGMDEGVLEQALERTKEVMEQERSNQIGESPWQYSMFDGMNL